MWGVLNGNIGVAKTYLAEISDDTNLSKGMAYFGVIGSIGRVVGPIIGGLLSYPAVNMPSVFRGTVFEAYPFALPSMVITVNCLIMFAVAYVWLSETLVLKTVYPLDGGVTGGGGRSTRREGLQYSALRSSDEDATADSSSAVVGSSTDDTGYDEGVEMRSMDSIENGEVANPLLASKESGFVPLKSGAQRMSGETDGADDEEEEEDASILGRGRVSVSEKAKNGKVYGGGRRGVRKSISFSSLVKVKTIDLPHITYQGLKQVAADEVPLGMISRGELEGGGDLEAMEAGTRNARRGNSDPAIPEDETVEDDPSPRSEGSQKVYSPLMAEEGHSSSSRESLLPRVRYSNGAEFFESMDSSQKSLATNLAYLMRQKQIVVSTTLYGFSSFVVVIGNEIFTLWVVTSRADGGLGYNTQQIGVAVMICGVIGTLLQLTLFPYASDRLGTLGVHRYGGLMFAVNSLFIPCIPYISSDPTVTMIIVVLALTMQSVAATWYLISTFVLISNSCYSHQLATVNGIGQTCASLGRLSGPYLGSVLFAWSETNGMEWPFNQYLVYYLLALLCVLIYQYSFLLPKSIQRRKREPKFRNWDDADAHYRREQEREQTLAQEREQGQEQKQEEQLSTSSQIIGNGTDAPESEVDSTFKTGSSELVVRVPEILNGQKENAPN